MDSKIKEEITSYETFREEVQKFKQPEKVFFLKYGFYMKVATLALSGGVINLRLRRIYNLKTYAIATTTFGTAVVSATVGGVFDQMAIMKPMVTSDFFCPPCLCTKSALMSGFTGSFYPLGLAFALCMAFSSSYSTFSIPVRDSGTLQYLKEINTMLKPIRGVVGWCFLLNVVIASGITAYQVENYITMIKTKYNYGDKSLPNIDEW